ncbi:hypothetical protein [Microbacterium sp. C7(2022)]|uniref:hypothetical protein n=1 Tax=Microbacterium sp. C7(2022) TaxID=2992759 RepID=UPI00237A3B9C|nr:hypothetical protein [Microbacterium sp. C7(2022)]MDE0546718.1 hypothetical protein [Microbacterium sp. C7(2022)]
MLVRINNQFSRDDTQRGSTLVVVLIVMLVLSIAGLTLAAIVTSTTGMLVSNRSTAESRAAADAGLAEGVAQARRTGDFCSLSLSSASAPSYTVTSSCADNKVTFVSTGTGKSAGQTKTQAVYNYTVPAVTGEGAELVFFNAGTDSVEFTNHVVHESSGLATVLFPSGGAFECKTTVPANVYTAGSMLGQSGCTINGSLFAGGANPVNTDKAVYLNNSDQVLGNVVAVGNVLLGNSPAKIGGTLTVPKTAKVITRWSDTLTTPTSVDASINGGKTNGIVWSDSLGKPTFDPWFDYNFKASDWPGYDIVTLTATSTPYNCTNFKGSATTFWNTYITGLSKNTVVDATVCTGGWDTALGADSTASIGVNVAFIGTHFTLGNFTLKPKTGTTPKAWFIVPDKVADNKPTCPSATSGGGGNGNGNGNGNGGGGSSSTDGWIETDASVNVTVTSMMYTPCIIQIGNGGTWTGSMYSGSLNDGGTITIKTVPIGWPGQWGSSGSGSTGTPTLGSLVSQRDVP